MMNAADHTDEDFAPEAGDLAHLRFAKTRRGEITLLAVLIAFAILMSIGAVLYGSSSWPHQACGWLGVVSALLLATLLAANIFRPRAVTVKRVRAVMIALLSSAALAILLGVLGFFV